MASIDWPREADTEQIADRRRTALGELAGLLLRQRYTVQTGAWHLVASRGPGDGWRPLEIWCQARPDDGNRLWFTWAGGIPVCEADKPADALMAVKAALRRVGAA
jgi:hypothetical protein